MINERNLKRELINWQMENADIEHEREHDVIGKAIKLVEGQPKIGKWIPVSKELPKRSRSVLLCGPKGGIFIGQRQGKTENDFYTWWDNQYKNVKVVAWQPLPEPYKP